jgi:WD40 repeat protein
MRKPTLSTVIAVALLLGLTVPAIAQSDDTIRHPIAVLGRGTANALSWHPDGEVLAVGSGTGIWLLDEALHITGHHTPLDYVTDLAWSPSGEWIALAGHSGETCHVQIWSADFASSLADLAFCGERILWSPDHARLAVFESDPFSSQYALFDASSGQQIALLPADSGIWSIDGATFITEEWDYQNEQANLFT